MPKPITASGSAIVGGLSGFAIALAVALVMNRESVWNGIAAISAGDWLQVLAPIVGIALTVRATMWLEERKRTRDRSREQRLLRESLSMLRSISTVARQPLDPALSLNERRNSTAAHYELVLTTWDSAKDAQRSFRADNYNLWSALNALAADFAKAEPMLRREENILRGNVTEPILAISRAAIERFATDIEPPISTAMEALG